MTAHSSVDKQAFANWESNATVRSRPRRLLSGATDAIHFFRPDLVPTSVHERVAALGPAAQEKVLVHHLLNYLRFTESLEHKVVNQVAFALGTGEIELSLSTEMRLAAMKLLVDESYHAYFSADLEQQVIAATGVEPVAGLAPAFLIKLNAIRTKAEAGLRPMIDLFFTVVSETLISGTLTKVPWDKSVVAVVREVLKDHADDEAIHHVYFANVLHQVWPQLGERVRREIGPLLPEFIFGFLEPDFAVIVRSLEAVGLTMAQAAAVVEDCYPRKKVLAGVRQAAAVTLAHFHNVGIFADDYIAEAFEARGLEPRGVARNPLRIAPEDVFRNTGERFGPRGREAKRTTDDKESVGVGGRRG